MFQNYPKLLLAALLLFCLNGFSQTNLLTNGGLENWSGSPETPTEWGILNAPTYSKTTDANEGNFAIKIPLTEQAGPFKATFETIGNNNIQLEANKTYTFSADYKVVAATVQSITAYVLRDGNIQVETGSQNPPEDGSWHTLTFDVNTTFATEHSIDIELTANGAGAEILIDNIKLLGESTNTDRDALVALYNATNGDNWTNSWDLNADMSTWAGVTIIGGRVWSLVLTSFGLDGSIPSEIGQLSELTMLGLGRNQLTGTVPTEIGSLQNLQRLNLDNNDLTGNIPTSVLNMSGLLTVQLQNNDLTGNLPIFSNSFSTISTLDLRSNNFVGNIPVVYGSMTNCRKLDLRFMALSGSVPSELGNLSNLEELYLSGLPEPGPIPVSLGNLTKLKKLEIESSNLTGNIPVELANLPNLERAWFATNNLEGNIPVFMSPNFTSLLMRYNNFVFENFTANYDAGVPMTYAPQNQIEVDRTVAVNENESFTLSAITNSPNNIYAWRRNGQLIQNATERTFIVASAKPVNSGVYSCTITNALFPDLTLSIESISVTVNPIDSDNDGVNDSSDNCPNTPSGQSVDANGCSPSQLDDDNDGVTNNNDTCPNTPTGQMVDTNGCSQSQLDDDNDGVNNNNDNCANTPSGETVDANGCAQSQLDDDNDGVTNNNDNCANTPSGEAVDANGCSQSQLDDDNDGVTNNNDNCPNTPNGTTVDTNGCPVTGTNDADNDGIADSNDTCPNTPTGETVNTNGCSESQLDDDNDGVTNDNDNCANTTAGEAVNANGCSESQLDDDNDGVTNNNDNCANTTAGEAVNANGCSESQLDDDNDGVTNNNDNCPNTPTGNTVDAQGCTVTNSGQVNYLQNFSFENWSGNPISPDDWTIANENSIIRNTEATDGTFSLELDLNNSLQFKTELQNQTAVQLATNTTYTYAFDYKVKRGNNISAEIQITKDGNPFGIRIADEFIPFNADGNWHTFSFDFDTNNTDEEHFFTLLFRANTTITGLVQIDNLRVLGDALPDGDNDGVLDANDQCPNTPASALAVDDVGCEVNIDGSNLLEDPSFEDWSLGGGDNLSNWGRNLIPGSSWNKNEDISDNLQYSLELTTGNNGSNASSIFQNDIEIYKGVEYIVSIDYKVLEGSFNSLELELSEDIFAEPSALFSINPTEAGWVTFSTTFTPTKNEIVDLRIAVVSDQQQERILLDNTIIRANVAGPMDDDNDGVANANDTCPNTPTGEAVNTDGCSDSQLDDDNDGVTNNNDTCPNTPTGSTVDANGCIVTGTNDADNDGVADANDSCPNTPTGEAVNTNGCSDSQLDDDNDGVTNNNDNCPNTPTGTTVDAQGCASNQSSEPNIQNNSIQVKVTSTSCLDSENGEISVSFTADYTYTVQIKANLLDNTFENINSSTGLVRSDLPADTYSVCVTIPDYPNFEQCFTVIVETPEDFTSGKVVVDKGKKTGKMVVSGSKTYILQINEKEHNFTFDTTENHELTFELEDGLNNVIVKTDKECQGTYEESLLFNLIRTFPNPVLDNTTIIGIQNTDNATILISDMSGSIVKSIQQRITNSTVNITVEDLPVGVYLLRIISKKQDVQTKIVKK